MVAWSTLTATHFWDCNGASCDAPTLKPWDETKYSFAPQYAPRKPSRGGVGPYGETLWLVGAASDALSQKLGPDTCCGKDDTGVGGCGRCVLVRNPSAAANLTAVVMKKSRCPPETNLCGVGAVHMDIAAPGFEYLAESTANVCGGAVRDQTWLSQPESGACTASPSVATDGNSGSSSCDCSWTGEARTNCGTNDGSTCWRACCAPAPVPASCCSSISAAAGAAERQRLRAGCELFASWGWTNGAPSLEYQPVACPADFISAIATAFNADGVAPTVPAGHSAALPKAPPLPPVSPLPAPSPPPPPSSPPQPPASGLSQGSVISIAFGCAVGLLMYLVWGRCNWSCRRSRATPRSRSEGPSVLRVTSKRVRGAFASSGGAMAYRAGCGAPPAAPPASDWPTCAAAGATSPSRTQRRGGGAGAVEMVLPESLAEGEEDVMSAPRQRVEVV